MARREQRFWWAVGLAAALVSGVAIGVVVATRSEGGRRWLADVAQRQARQAFGGRATLTIGSLRSVGSSRISARNVSVLDSAGVVVLHADSVDGSISLRGIVFGRVVHLRALALHGVRLDLRKEFVGPWNVAHILAGDTTRRVAGPPGLSSNIRIDSLTLQDVVVTTSAPWAPHPVFTGAARDSVIAVRDSLHDLLRTPDGLLERRRIVLERVVAHHAIITRPTDEPSSIDIDTLRGTISDPPIRVIAASGKVGWTPDSLRFAIPDLRLPASAGSAAGTVSWHDAGPVRYDVALTAQAGLSDLGWIWDVLPQTGHGTARVRMRTLADAFDTEYALSDLDVQSMDSRVAGSISVTVRPADLLLHDVALTFSPLQSALMRRLSYDAVPEIVNGSFSGTLVAKAGGPLTAFRIDTLRAAFRDAQVTDATSRLTLSGLFALGARPSARDVAVREMQVDLRSLAPLAPTMPPLDGTVGGSFLVVAASLDAAKVREAALSWSDAAGNTSRVTGEASVGFGPRNAALETALQFAPLSLRALARVDTTLALRADVEGVVHTTGSIESLAWDARFGATDGGVFDVRGTASLIGGTWRATAAGNVEALNARAWLVGGRSPETAVGGTVRVDASGTRDARGALSLATAVAAVALSQRATDDRPAFDLFASARLDEQRLLVDSASAHLGGVALDARGALARNESGVDTMQVSLRADSLAVVRSELIRVAGMVQSIDSATAASMRRLAADTLRGEASLSGFLVGSLRDLSATLAVSARETQVGGLHIARLFGSLHADSVLSGARFAGAATADGVDGIGAIRIVSAELQVKDATPAQGRLVVDVSSRDAAHLVLRGAYARDSVTLDVVLDTVRFSYDSVAWRNSDAVRLHSDARGIRVDSAEVRSNRAGVLSIVADLPASGPVQGALRFDRFPVGEAATFALGTSPFDGRLSGELLLRGTRDLPLLSVVARVDSLGRDGVYLPEIRGEGSYADRRFVARARIADTLGGVLRAEARVPMDLRLRTVEKRVLSDAVDAEIVADSLRLQSLGFVVAGVTDTRGIVDGRLGLSGSMDRPVATGTMTLDQFSASIGALGIAPTEGRMVVRAAKDSLILQSLRFRSGGVADTLFATGAMRFAVDTAATVRARVIANNLSLARQEDGTILNLSGRVDARGALARPELSGTLFVPNANLVFDPLGARKALDLTSAGAQELLGADEVPVAASAVQSVSRLGRYLSVADARVDLGDGVWVQTPESRVKITGGLAVTMSGDKLALEGEVNVNRGQYRLDLGVVNRSFAVDSGSVRFFGTDAIEPTVDISATNVVRLATGGEIPVRVHIGGTIERPVVTLSSSDPLFASAPESEIISLLIFGAPTFALDGQSQNTVRAVTGVLLPSVGGAVEGALQRLLPVFNTVQINTAGGQDDLKALSLLDNLSISAGKQLGPRAFLRVNTGVCRVTGQGASLWYGLAAEYRIARGFTGQIGVDPGSAPCTRLGGDLLPRMQFGFDLFREWIF